MLLNAIITSLIVSIDGFFIGISIGLKKIHINFKKLLLISIIPILMAIPIMFLGNFLSIFISNNISKYIGFILYIVLAITSFNEKNNNENNINLLNIILIGFTIGIDSSISAFSLALNGYNPIITPFYFGISHGILIYLGNFLTYNNIIKTNININYLSPTLFIILAISKLI